MSSVTNLNALCNGDHVTTGIYQNENAGKEYCDAATRTLQDTIGLTPDELVLLYQNIDAETHLVSTTSDTQWRESNECVETVIQDNHGGPGLEISRECSWDDINNIFVINNERLDLLSNPSFETSLDHKCGCVDFDHIDFINDYNPHFLLKDSYKHFRILNNMTMELESYELPKSLLDYIYCKRLEDNFSFDMSSIIKYVKNTIEQLRRISNGDYMSEIAKEKWYEVGNVKENVNYKDVDLKINKVLANTARIPLYAEGKTTNNVVTWDDIVHSEVDLRSLCKLLEKQIIIEIPKLINCPYTLFSKSWTDGVVLRCMRKSKTKSKTCPRVEVFLQIQRSKSGKLLNTINSVMILRKTSALNLLNQLGNSEALGDTHIDPMKIVDLDSNTEEKFTPNINKSIKSSNDLADNGLQKNDCADNTDFQIVNNTTSNNILEMQENFCPVTALNGDNTVIDSSTELMLSIKQLNVECTVHEEADEQAKLSMDISKSNKRKQPTLKTRTKSPYENKSIAQEEKKRKRLLEIREKREKRKLQLSENCKIKKNKYGKSFVQAQASSSVTRLSITNKSFYRSIFGDGLSIINSQTSEKYFKASAKYNFQENNDVILVQNKNKDSESSISTSLSDNIPIFTITNDNVDGDTLDIDKQFVNVGDNICEENKVPSNSPKMIVDKSLSRNSIPLELKESIDKIYDAISSQKYVAINSSDVREKYSNQQSLPDDGTIPESDSLSSIKCQLTSSVPSSCSFNKTHKKKNESIEDFNKNQLCNPEPMIPKVVISSKIKNAKQETTKCEKSKDCDVIDTSKKCKNPLNTISRIINQIEDVRKAKKIKDSDRSINKSLVSNNMKHNINANTRKYSDDFKDNKKLQTALNKNNKKPMYFSEKNGKLPTVLMTSQKNNIVKQNNNIQNYKITSIIEEARVENVRQNGPSRNISRINYLAQPRNYSVNNEEFQRKYGRNFNTNRIQKIALQPLKEKTVFTMMNKVNIMPSNNMKMSDAKKLIDKPVFRKPQEVNKDKVLRYHPKPHSQIDVEKKSVSFAKPHEFDPMKRNQDLAFYKDRMNNKTKNRDETNLYRNKLGNRFTPTNFGFIEPSQPRNQTKLHSLQLHKIVNKILNKTELNDLPEDSESNISDSLNKKCDVPKYSSSNLEVKKSKVIEYFEDDKKENKNIIQINLPTVDLAKSLFPNTSSDIYTKDSQCLSIQDDSIYTTANSLITLQSNLPENVSNSIFCDLKLSMSGISLHWPLKQFQVATVGYVFPNLSNMNPIRKVLQHTISSMTNSIKMLDKPVQVVEICETKMEVALQTNIENNASSSRIFCNKSIQSDFTLSSDMYETDNDILMNNTSLHNNTDSISSLDVLVNLLNEIQTITTCQSEIVKSNIEHLEIEAVSVEKEEIQNDNNDLNNPENLSNNNISKNTSQCCIQEIIADEFSSSEFGPQTNTEVCKAFSIRVLPNEQFNYCKTSDNELQIHENYYINKKYEKIEEINGKKFELITHKPVSLLETEDKSTIKIKRDLLVTVYSVLILTVFAALSIPELIHL